MADQNDAATVREWTDLVRRAELNATTKLIALTVASYADADGTRVFPGVARLAVETGKGYSTVKRVLAFLRKAGLLRVVRRPTRQHPSTEYQLTLSDHTGEYVTVPTPSEHRQRIKDVDDAHRSTACKGEPSIKGPTAHVVSRGPEKSTAHSCEPRTEVDGSLSTGRRLTQVDPYLDTDLDTRTTAHSGEDIRTAVTPVRAREAATKTDSPSEASTPDRPDPPPLRLVTNPRPPQTATANVQPALWPTAVREEPTAVNTNQAKAAIRDTLRGHRRAPMTPYGVRRQDTRPVPVAEPVARPIPTEGHGFCITCYAAGRTTVAVDPVNGSACTKHIRAKDAS